MANDLAMWLVWRGVSGDEQIWGANWFANGEGTEPTWHPHHVLGGGAFNSSHAPAICALVSIPDHAQMVWKGSGGDQRIFGSPLSSWPTIPTGPVPPLGGPDGLFLTIGRPAIASRGASNDLILVWQNPTNELVWSIRESNTSWTTPRLTGLTSSHGPALATLGESIVLVRKALEDETMGWARLSDNRWIDLGPIPVAAGAAKTSDVPSLLVRENGLSMAWKGVASDPHIWLSDWHSGGARWSAPRQAEPEAGAIFTSHGPALASLIDVGLRLFWKGAGEDQRIWTSFQKSNGQWSTPGVLNDAINSNASPAIASYTIGLL